VRDIVIPYERDPRSTAHGPSEELIEELRGKARQAGVLTPHIRPDGSHLTQRETATVLTRTGLSPLGPLACNHGIRGRVARGTAASAHAQSRADAFPFLAEVGWRRASLSLAGRR
jgi:hypothetical protein